MFLIVDANVLIDYLNADVSILKAAATYLGTIYVPREIVDEVTQINEQKCKQLKLTIVDADTDQLLEAGSSSTQLSFEDWVCFILARDNAWTCVSNDLALHKNCKQAGVSSMWGLELMIELVNRKQLTSSKARRVANKISKASGGRITEAILKDFQDRLTK